MNEETLSVAEGELLPEELLADDAQAAELSAEELMGGPHVESGAQQPESTGENGGQSGAQDGGDAQRQEDGDKFSRRISAALRSQRKKIFDELGADEAQVREIIRAHKAAQMAQGDPDISLKAARRIVEAEERQDRSAARQEELRADLQSLREDGFTDEELRALVTDSGVREDWQGGMSLRRAAMSYMRRQADSARAQRQEKAPGRATKRGVETVKTASAAAVRRNAIEDMSDEEFRAFDRRLMDAAMNGQRVRL